MADDVVLPIPNLHLPQYLFTVSQPSLSQHHDNAREELLKAIEADEMAPYYSSIVSQSSQTPLLPENSALLEKLQAANTTALAALDEKLASAQATEGESEISDALKARANYLTRIGDKEKAIEAQKLALEKTPGLGSRIDIVLTLIRIGFFWSDNDLIVWGLSKANSLVDEGGDWDRRNRLKVYQGLHLLTIRQFKRASELLLDALSTFTATELLSYNDFVAFTVISSCLALERVDLKKKVISAPEVNQTLPDIPILGDLVKSLYDCKYDKFFIALATLEQTYLLPSRIFSPHTRYYVREMRIKSYGQLLQSYRSLTLESMGTAFGVTSDFIDIELARFIASGRLAARIDKVNGVVETTRPERKTSGFESLIKQGDVVLSEIQKLRKGLY